MAKITRKLQKLFSGGAPALGNRPVFASLKAGNIVWTDDPDLIQSPAYDIGWGAATIPRDSPTQEDFNSLFFLITRQISYIMQTGVPEWDFQTTYYTGSFCSIAGVLYVSRTDDNVNQNPLTVPAAWTAFSGGGAPPATDEWIDIADQATVDIAFAAARRTYNVTISNGAPLTFTSSAWAQALEAQIIIRNTGAAPLTINFPAAWAFLGDIPTTVAAGKVLVVGTQCSTAAESGVIAGGRAQA